MCSAGRQPAQGVEPPSCGKCLQLSLSLSLWLVAGLPAHGRHRIIQHLLPLTSLQLGGAHTWKFPSCLADIVHSKSCFQISSWICHHSPVTSSICHHVQRFLQRNSLPFTQCGFTSVQMADRGSTLLGQFLSFVLLPVVTVFSCVCQGPTSMRPRGFWPRAACPSQQQKTWMTPPWKPWPPSRNRNLSSQLHSDHHRQPFLTQTDLSGFKPLFS